MSIVVKGLDNCKVLCHDQSAFHIKCYLILNYCKCINRLFITFLGLLTGTITDVCETVLTSEGVRDNAELAPDVVRDRFLERGIPPLATMSSPSPLVCSKTPIAC